jgi:hypothetical protein
MERKTAVITVNSDDKGFSIMVTNDKKSIQYPEVLITHKYANNQTTFQVFNNFADAITETDYDTLYQQVQDDPQARNFLQVAYLVYKQKMAVYQAEIEKLVDEILQM